MNLFLAKWVLIIGTAVLAIGCSSSGPVPALNPNNTDNLPIPQPTAVISTAPLGVNGGTLTLVATSEIPHKDVHQEVQETLTALGPGLAYSRLLRLRSGEGNQPNLLLECDLCQSWHLTNDLSYIFNLRPSVHWQNIAPVNGRTLTANDVVFSLNRLKTPGWPNAALLSSIGEVEALEELTIQVDLILKDADALLALADGHTKIVAPEAVLVTGDLKDGPVIGTGPWIWQENADERMEFTRNPDYFEKELPFLDQLNVAIMRSSPLVKTSNSNKVAAFHAGLIDVLPVGPSEWDMVRSGDYEFQTTISRRSGAGVVLAMNSQKAGLKETSVRQAVFQAIDPWDYLDTVWSGEGFASVGVPVKETDWLLDRSEMRQQFFADPGKARQLLLASGLTLPIKLEISIRTERTGIWNLRLEEKLISDLTAVGFTPELRRMNPVQFNDLVIGTAKDFQLAVGAIPPTSTTNSYLFGLLHSQGQWNLAVHNDSQLDSMIEEQAAEFDNGIRRDQLVDIQRRILDQAYIFSPVTAISRWVYSNDLKGFEPHTALSEYNFWSRTWLDR